jgi:hypothetical protein
MLLFLAACSDYALNEGTDKVPGLVDSAPPRDTAPPVDTGDSAPPQEECNGSDDDGDGAVDEDFGDIDADGVADCLDAACVADVVGAGTVARAEVCDGTATVLDPWDTTATTTWASLSTASTIESIAQTPVFMQMTDDDGDGDIDADDELDVAFLAWENGSSLAPSWLVVIDAATGAEHLALEGCYFGGEIAVGDVDGDGAPEILGYDPRNRLMAVRMDGTSVWTTSPMTAYIGGRPAVAIVDLEGDGRVEVLAQESILDGATGAAVGALPARAFSFTQHVVGDLDLDGVAEILYDGAVHTADGALSWSGLVAGGGSMVTGVMLDVDGDPEGEVVLASDMTMAVYDTDGTELTRRSWGSGFASVPCAGDFDGDGAPEIAVPAQYTLHIFEVDGTEIATAPIVDTSTASGCVGADLDGDGALEVVYADEEALYVLDGRTGTARVTYTEHASGTLLETPAIVDSDADGAAEIWLGSNDNSGRDIWMGLTRVEHAGGGWTAGPGSWPANARVEGRFDATGGVVDIGTWWARENTFRAVGSTSPPLVRDAAVGFDDVCLASCEPGGPLVLTAHVASPGGETLPADTDVVLSRLDAGVATEISRLALGVELSPGESGASLAFDVTREDVGAEGVQVSVGTDVADCRPADNVATWSDLPECP